MRSVLPNFGAVSGSEAIFLYYIRTAKKFIHIIHGGISLGLLNYLKKIRDDYVINQVKNIILPAFQPSPTVREGVKFTGRVQKVGFRLEIYELAKRLELSGWVQNTKDRNVEAELQGEQEKIEFLINYMRSLKRASVREVVKNQQPVREEAGFVIRG